MIERTQLPIPMAKIGPLVLRGDFAGEYYVPLATYEQPLFPSIRRGMAITQKIGGITVHILQHMMTRSILFIAPSASEALKASMQIQQEFDLWKQIITQTSRFATLQTIMPILIGNLLFLRIGIHTGDAAGHNMVTLAADRLIQAILDRFPWLRYGSVSGNLCTDKKVSAINSILGRGYKIIADVQIPSNLLKRYLHVDSSTLVQINIQKNFVGSIAAGSLCSANAHYANMLLAFYLATGQDAANIVEGSQGITYAECRGDTLYFSCTIPNLIVGTVGNGKEGEIVQQNLRDLGCLPLPENPGYSAQKLAAIAGGVVLCGELSLLAALAKPGELMKAHLQWERQRKGSQPHEK